MKNNVTLGFNPSGKVACVDGGERSVGARRRKTGCWEEVTEGGKEMVINPKQYWYKG